MSNTTVEYWFMFTVALKQSNVPLYTSRSSTKILINKKMYCIRNN